MIQTIRPAAYLEGTVRVPPDKSVAHRTALLSALAGGTSHIVGYPDAADPQSTLACLRQLGVAFETDDEGILHVEGAGLGGLKAPDGPLDCGNSGTTMRLLAGILAGQPFDSVLTGDASLTQRPMERIAAPLRQMGAQIELTDGHAPIRITGGQPLKGITYPLPVASAQVKSCVLLAGLYAEGETTVIETRPARDHTERMLELSIFETGESTSDAAGTGSERHVTIEGGYHVAAQTWAVPGDFSGAAFFLVAGSIVPGSRLRLPGVGLNPSRSAALDVLSAMGAAITVKNERARGSEPLADLIVKSAELHGTQIGGRLIPNLIDEIPVLAVAAACAEGRTVIRDAAELRVKETDRIAAIAAGLRALGAAVEPFDDGFAVEGGATLSGTAVDAEDDHRIAMALGVAGLVAAGETQIEGAEAAGVSFPGFWDELERVAIDR